MKYNKINKTLKITYHLSDYEELLCDAAMQGQLIGNDSEMIDGAIESLFLERYIYKQR